MVTLIEEFLFGVWELDHKANNNASVKSIAAEKMKACHYGGED